MATKVARLTSSTPTRGVGHPWKCRFKPCLLFGKFYNGSHTDTSPIQFDIGDILCDGRLTGDDFDSKQPSHFHTGSVAVNDLNQCNGNSNPSGNGTSHLASIEAQAEWENALLSTGNCDPNNPNHPGFNGHSQNAGYRLEATNPNTFNGGMIHGKFKWHKLPKIILIFHLNCKI